MDQTEAPPDIRKQWREARANRRMQFKVGNYKDGDRESNIRMLTGAIKAMFATTRYCANVKTLAAPSSFDFFIAGLQVEPIANWGSRIGM